MIYVVYQLYKSKATPDYYGRLGWFSLAPNVHIAML